MDRSAPVLSANQGIDDVEVGSLPRLLEAVNFAAEKHKCQRRKDPEATPYINHPIGVARILSSEAGVSDTIALEAAILHDTVEDTDTSFEELETVFGRPVAQVVQECSDDKLLPAAERKRIQILHTPHASVRAKLVKSADKIYNLRDLERVHPVGWTRDRVDAYFLWSAQVCSGLRGVNANLDRLMAEIFDRQGLTKVYLAAENSA
uniref:Guanosine-3',5'-bis(diphosphate) 3'-pyrophosphohydrolase MESH1 n=2 Tax=Macrostomum lignano TaxID=282301 RepID=A0A1I8GZ89_9PLAT